MSMSAIGNVGAWGRWIGRLRPLGSLDAKAFRLALIVFAGLGATYVAMSVKAVVIGLSHAPFGDFHAIWVSGVLAHQGTPLLNYDDAALHAAQTLSGLDPRAQNPFPYPPTFLLLLAPLGALPLALAFWIFMGGSFALFVTSMVAGRRRDPIWWLAALAAPVSGITIVSGQSGFLSGALMIGGLRLASARPWISGVLFGLLTFKPQLGVLVPVALVAAGLWRVAAAAALTGLAGFIASGCVFGFAIWPGWLQAIRSYSNGFDVVTDLMPTIAANFSGSAFGPQGAMVLQVVSAVAVGLVVWRAFRAGVTEKGIALVVVGTFLATPHAFNYDLPMTAAAIAAYLAACRDRALRFPLIEAAIVAAVFVLPLAILAGRAALAPWSWTPLAALFALIAMRGEMNPAPRG